MQWPLVARGYWVFEGGYCGQGSKVLILNVNIASV